VPRFQRSYDPDRPGQVLSEHGEPVAMVVWTHDYGDRDHTGWWLVMLDGDAEPDGEPPQRLDVSPEIDRLGADTRLDRAAWLMQAETLELVTAPAAVAAGERRLAQLLDGAS
jgi:hypothetical protein